MDSIEVALMHISAWSFSDTFSKRRPVVRRSRPQSQSLALRKIFPQSRYTLSFDSLGKRFLRAPLKEIQY